MIALSLFSAAVSFIVLPARVSGQGTSAICGQGYEWMDNSLGQSPCLVSSYLLSQCPSVGEVSWVFPLSAGYHYQTPENSSTSATPCRCSTVFYSTISACATCQGEGTYVPFWTTYATNCETVYIQEFPKAIPDGTAIPAWAYVDVRTNNDFSSVAAQSVANEDLPESTALSGSTGTSTGSRTALSTGSASTARGSQSTSVNGSNSDTGNGTTSSKKSTNIAPIVGGVVGGVVGVIVIGLALFFWLRRRRNSARYAPTSPVDLTAGEYSPGYNDKSHPTVYNEVPSASPLTTTEYSHPIPPPLPSPKVYDPDDPSTFPESSDTQAPSSHDSAAYASPVHAHLATVPYTYTPPSPYQPATSASSTAAYKGVPEL